MSEFKVVAYDQEWLSPLLELTPESSQPPSSLPPLLLAHSTLGDHKLGTGEPQQEGARSPTHPLTGQPFLLHTHVGLHLQ